MTILLHKPYLVKRDYEWGVKIPKNLTTWYMDDPIEKVIPISNTANYVCKKNSAIGFQQFFVPISNMQSKLCLEKTFSNWLPTIFGQLILIFDKIMHNAIIHQFVKSSIKIINHIAPVVLEYLLKLGKCIYLSAKTVATQFFESALIYQQISNSGLKFSEKVVIVKKSFTFMVQFFQFLFRRF